MGTTLSVTFRAGGAIAAVGSAGDTNIVTIQHLPADTSVAVVRGLLSRAGFELPSEAIRAMPVEDATYATAKFGDAASAAAAIRALDGRAHEDHTLAAKPYQTKGLANVSQSATRVSVTFFSPARIASVNFSTHRAAQTATQACDGKRIRGRTVECKVKSRSTGTAGEVSVGGLAAATTEDDVRKVFRFGVRSVFLHQPTYALTAREAMTSVASLLARRTPEVEGWDVVSLPGARKTKATVRFRTAAAALEAVRLHDGTTCDFLGGSRIFLQPMYTANFKIVPEIHRAVAPELQRLAREQPVGVQIRVFGGGAHALATVRITGQDRKLVSSAKTVVGKIVKGRPFRAANGEAIRNRFWATAEGIQAITTIGHETKTFVFCDKRKSQLFLFGAAADQEKAAARLHEHLASLARRSHEIALEGAAWKAIVRGGLRALQERFGAAKVVADAAKRCIVFTGSAAELDELQTSLLRSAGARDVTATAADGDCPICFDTAESATRFAACGHVYCLACLRDYARSTLDTRVFPLTCLSEGCSHALDLPVLAAILSPAEYEAVLTAAFTDHIRRHPAEFSYCPTPNCATVYRLAPAGDGGGRVISCADCLLDICTACAVEAHDGLSCAEHKAAKHSDAAADAAFDAWKLRNRVHACPTCGTDIQKADGCDHITCASCKAHICWKCLSVFTDGPKVYSHMNSVHGSIGIGYE